MIHAHTTCRLTRNSELKTIGENDILNFAVATDHGYGDKKTTTFINCSLFGKRAATLAKFLTKGAQIVMHGEIFTREYKAKDGTMKTSVECRVSEIDLVGGKRDNNGESKSDEPAPYGKEVASGGGDFDDGIPFNRMNDFQH